MIGHREMLYDKKDIRRDLIAIAVLMAVMFGTGGIGFIVVVPLMIRSVIQSKPEKAFFWLLLMVAALVGNEHLFAKGSVFYLSQRALMCILGIIMVARVSQGRRSALLAPFLAMLGYVLFMVISSAFGWCPVVSFLKLFLFGACYISFVGIAKMVCDSRRDVGVKIRSAILAFAIVFLVGSILLIPFPGISQLSGEAYEAAIASGVDVISLFTGMAMHSQSLGPMVAMLNVILLADMLFSVKRFDRLYCALLLCCPVLIYKTSSRTGMGTYLLSSLYVVYLMMKARGVGGKWRNRAMSTIMSLVSLAVIALLVMPGSREGAQKFLIKDSKAEGNLDVGSVMASRAGLVEFAIYNFKRSPWIGNGFQVSEDMGMMRRSSDSLMDVLSAPVEKGVWYAAVLEEGGAIGFCIFTFILFLLIFQTVKCRGYITSSCMVAFTLSNFGEFTFFSMSYTGGMAWCMVFTGVILDALRIRSQQQEKERMVGHEIR